MGVEILIGDARDRLKELAGSSVHCCVTSPPYFGLRDYGHDGQMGLEKTHDEYVAGMVALFRDLWRFSLPETKPFNVWLRCEPFNFERWELIAQELNDGRDNARIMAEAAAMQRFFDQKVAEIGRLSRRGLIDGHEVPMCNCPPMFASEVGHWLLEQNPFAPFVACYSDQGKSRGFSLRSRDGRMDVSEVARKFGGGGHRNAAGFGVPLP